MPVTMSDIARDLHLSVVTVSKVLRNKGQISMKTRKLVLDRAEKLGYRPNWIARSLATRRTYTIGLVLPEFTHLFFAEIAKAVAETVREHGYHILITYSEESPALEKSETDSLLARQVDGLIIASAQTPEHADFFAGIRQRKTPFVLIDRFIPGVSASFVGVDDEEIGRLATEHLLSQGCRAIAHLRGPRIGLAEHRLNGFLKTLEKNGLRPLAHHVVEAGFTDQSGYDAMRKMLGSAPLPDGVFCYNDPVAIGAMKAVIEHGLRVPADVAVAGAGNVHYSDMLAVPLTTVDQQASEVGRKAATLLLEQIDQSRAAAQKILLPPRLVARQSTLRTAEDTARRP